METLIVYCSLCGSTKRYAEDLGKSLDATVLPIKKLNKKAIQKAKTIIFGGWVNNGEIKGLNDFLSFWNEMSNKNVIVYSCGVVIPTVAGRKLLIDTNCLTSYHIRFYQLRGSFNLNNLKFPYSFLVKTIIKAVEKKSDATEEQRAFVELKNHPVDYYDHEGIEKIESVVRKLDSIIECEVEDK